VLPLTLLAPEVVEAILDGWQLEGMTLPGLMEPFPVEWEGHPAPIDVPERRGESIGTGFGLIT
jgi:hypothetical protein